MNQSGQLGERLVAEWLSQQGWTILQQGWRCRWGEIDLIAYQSDRSVLIFVEVKTRSDRSWDEGGAKAITAQKQVKLSKTAALFLASYPNFAELFCRFDVALVSSQKATFSRSKPFQLPITLGQTIIWEGYKLTLYQYLEGAFEFQSF